VSSPEEKDFGVSVGERLNVSQQCALAPLKANCILGGMKISMTSRLREMILPLCSALKTPTWSTASSSGVPNTRRA